MNAGGLHADQRIEITVSDPWDFVTECGSGPFPATVLRAGSDGSKEVPDLLISLDSPPRFQNTECKLFVARPRATPSKGSRLQDMPVALTLIPEERLKSENPLDLSWWRGGIGLIGTLRSR